MTSSLPQRGAGRARRARWGRADGPFSGVSADDLGPFGDVGSSGDAGSLGGDVGSFGGDVGSFGGDIGSFERGNRFSRWALGRYIVGRVILERVSWVLLLVAIVLLAVAAALEFAAHVTAAAVLFVILAVVVLGTRALLRAVLRRLTGAALYGPLERRADRIVKDSRSGVFAELRRVGLPSHLLTTPLIGVRLLRRRSRAATMTRIRSFDVERAVPRARRDELHLLLEQAVGSGPRS